MRARTVFVVLMLLVVPLSFVPRVQASNYGSQSSTSTHVNWGNDRQFAVYFWSNMSPYLKGRTLEVICCAYDGPTILTMYRTTSFDPADIHVEERNLGADFPAGGNFCPSSSTVSGSHPKRTCFPSRVTINSHHRGWYENDTHNNAWALLCHEIGHAVMLRHTPIHSPSCMEVPQSGNNHQLHSTEKSHLYLLPAG